MCASWNKNLDLDPNVVTNLLESNKSVKEGNVTFSGFDHYENVAVLQSMVETNDEIPDIEKSRIVNRAISAVARTKSITPQLLLGEISKLESEYLKKPPSGYVLLTSISMKRQVNNIRRRILDSTIIISSKAPSRFYRSEKMIKKTLLITDQDLPDLYSIVRVSLNARSEMEAGIKALDSLDLLRGMWNFSINQKQGMRISSINNSVNRLVLGPIHSLHLPNGKPADDVFWYETILLRSFYPTANVDLGEITKNEHWIRNKLNNHSYRSEIESAFIRYCRALDNSDLNTSYTKLWGLLETLVSSHRSSTITRRVSFRYRDNIFAKQLVTHLAGFRNRTIHAGATSAQIETLLYQLKRVTENLLIYHMHNRNGFRTMNEAARFLHLPQEKETLKDKIRLYEKALKFRFG